MSRDELLALARTITPEQLATVHPGRYSPRNQILIALQNPDATLVAGYRDWKRQGRQVRRGEHGLAILAPVPHRSDDTRDDERGALRGVRVAHVFDISQTDPIEQEQTA